MCVKQIPEMPSLYIHHHHPVILKQLWLVFQQQIQLCIFTSRLWGCSTRYARNVSFRCVNIFNFPKVTPLPFLSPPLIHIWTNVSKPLLQLWHLFKKYSAVAWTPHIIHQLGYISQLQLNFRLISPDSDDRPGCIASSAGEARLCRSTTSVHTGEASSPCRGPTSPVCWEAWAVSLSEEDAADGGEHDTGNEYNSSFYCPTANSAV